MNAVQARLLRAAKEDEKRIAAEISESMGRDLRMLEVENADLKTKIGVMEREKHDMMEVIVEQTKTLKYLGSRAEKENSTLTYSSERRGMDSSRRNTPLATNTPRAADTNCHTPSEIFRLEKLFISPASHVKMREGGSSRLDSRANVIDMYETSVAPVNVSRPLALDQDSVRLHQTSYACLEASPAINMLAKKFANDLKPVCQELDELRMCVAAQAERERSAQIRTAMLQQQLEKEIQLRKETEASLDKLQRQGLAEIEKCQQQIEGERRRAATVLQELEQSLLSERSQRQSDGRTIAAHSQRALRLSALAESVTGEVSKIRSELADAAAAAREQGALHAELQEEARSLRAALEAEQLGRAALAEEGREQQRQAQAQAAAEGGRFQQQLHAERNRAADVLREPEVIAAYLGTTDES